MSGHNPSNGVPNEVTWRQRAKQRAAAAAAAFGNDVEMQAAKPLSRNQPMALNAVQVASNYTASGLISEGKKTLAEQLGLKLKPAATPAPAPEPEPVVEEVQTSVPEPPAVTPTETQPAVTPVVEPTPEAAQPTSNASDDLL